MRIIWNIGIILSILFLPWWVTAIVTVAACFFVNKFFEAIFYGILLDAFYGTELGIHGFAYVFSAASVSVFLIATVIRRRVVW
jgi:hypothetical protein